MNASNARITHSVDICIIGGGIAGLCAAVAAARHGAKVLLMQDRPMLGGNASSEIRMWVRGAPGVENRETGILQELELENIYRNPTMNYSIWDSVLYQMAAQEPNIELLLNCSCLACSMAGEGHIASVGGWQLNTYQFHTVEASMFIDCSGDSILAPLSGAAYRVGREGKDEFGEYAAPEKPDRKTMGSSVLIQARETDRPSIFIPPEWAYTFPDDESMYLKNHDVRATNFWWIEVGGEMDTINDAQQINCELLKIAYGVWDHLKNQGDHGMENWELEWVGFLPGKRESRRYEGEYMLTQQDLEEGHSFGDAVAFGGWTMDNHNPKGFRHIGYSSTHTKPAVPYQIPFRCLYSRNVDNLLFAGRNISASHMAMSSTRVMATCALMGQAAGTGAAMAVRHGCVPADITRAYIRELQAALMEDGCYIPGLTRQVPDGAELSLCPREKQILQNGWERPHGDEVNFVALRPGSSLELELKKPGGMLRLALDPDFSRESISSVRKSQVFAMRSHIYLDAEPLKMPKNLLKSCRVTEILADGTEKIHVIENNRLPRIFRKLDSAAVKVILSELQGWGGQDICIFACDVR